MIWVAENRNIGMKIFQSMLGVGGGQRQSLSDFLVNNNIHAHAANGGILEQSVQSVFLIFRGRPSQVEFGR